VFVGQGRDSSFAEYSRNCIEEGTGLRSVPVVFEVGGGKTGLRTVPVSCFRRVLSFAEYTEEGGGGTGLRKRACRVLTCFERQGVLADLSI
jgi:hypothetical protein